MRGGIILLGTLITVKSSPKLTFTTEIAFLQLSALRKKIYILNFSCNISHKVSITNFCLATWQGSKGAKHNFIIKALGSCCIAAIFLLYKLQRKYYFYCLKWQCLFRISIILHCNPLFSRVVYSNPLWLGFMGDNPNIFVRAPGWRRLKPVVYKTLITEIKCWNECFIQASFQTHLIFARNVSKIQKVVMKIPGGYCFFVYQF